MTNFWYLTEAIDWLKIYSSGACSVLIGRSNMISRFEWNGNGTLWEKELLEPEERN